ncbi:enoyl-CoA hydratase-related protein [Shumkonia mesophila]|uniref:enoyl-CoA hydratase-related protein n=1 Tax=Shumkonia mesophila TaxID=2838854 RepID=UPI0029349C4F|nr:enoyl-CoA hydratase-related protein [Shumkonia mesophila]
MGHDLSVEFDINDQVTVEAVEMFRPDLIIAPYLRRAIPETVWRRHVCLIVHPGIKGDRGPSALDWAILGGEREWGVTVLQAAAEMDAGDIWASVPFAMRPGAKSSLYRREVTDAAAEAVLLAVERFAAGAFRPEPLDASVPDVRGTWHPLMREEDRAIDWRCDDTETILRKIRSADGFPGVRDRIGGVEFALFDAHPEAALRGPPGDIVGKRHEAICRATTDGAVWITHLKPAPADNERSFKRPAVLALGTMLEDVPEIPASGAETTWRDIWYEEKGAVGYLFFPFYNGAMGTAQCQRLEAAYRKACACDTRVVVLMGGEEFWSNGLHLGAIEAADSAPEESWHNINAMDDLCRAILTTGSHLTVAALRGNAGAGGVFLALAADRVMAASRIVLNPHYKNMGNLYGSEYWTYRLPKRVGAAGVEEVMGRRLPIGARQAAGIGLIDGCFEARGEALDAAIRAYAEDLAGDSFAETVRRKNERRQADERKKPLESYRREELERLRLNFFGFDPSYHVARYHFIRKLPLARTPFYLARHRRIGPRSG